jgi:hypothetical protein
LEYDVFDSGEINSFLAGCSQNQATARLLGICLERALRKGPDGLRPLENLNADAPGWLREKFCRADIAIFSRPVQVNLVAPLYPGFRAMQKHADEGS